MNENTLELNKLNEDERLKIATLLIKSGYTVSMQRKKSVGKAYKYYIVYCNSEEDREEV